MRESRGGQCRRRTPHPHPHPHTQILISQIYIAKLQINLQPPLPHPVMKKLITFFKDLCNKDKFIRQLSTECVIDFFANYIYHVYSCLPNEKILSCVQLNETEIY